MLGLALTSTDVSWALLAGDHVTDDAVLDDDAFAVDDGDEPAERAIAAARGAQAIAASSGHDVRSVGLTCDDDTATETDKLIAALTSAGFDDVRIVPAGLITDDDLSGAHGAARAVVTGAVAAHVTTPEEAPGRRRTAKWVWVGGASAAAVVIGVVAAGALFMVGDTQPAVDAAALTAAGSPEIVTAAAPRLTPPTIAVQAQDVQPARKVAARAGRPEAEAPVTTWTPPVEEAAKPVTPAAHPAVAAVAAPSTPATPTSAAPAAPLAVETAPAAHLPQNLPGPIAPGPAEAVAPVAPAQAAPTSTAAPATPTPTVTQASPAAASQVPTVQAPAPAPAQQPPTAPVNPFDIFASLP
ncbi:hypothetical protein [Mycobacterium aquaticum]|uniref:hypothetical protein n=1 Tax=Mycobacterium aquaticum TaxID=1927124 RepID=UPI001FE26658|nr:hypothetical protein [Mycobacterium aquaticum]